MSKATKRKSSSSGSKSRSSSIGAREKRLSVFERLGTKALPGEANRLCRHNIYHASCPTCSTPNPQVPNHPLGSSIKRTTKKDADIRPSAERGSPVESDWADWDQAELEYEDEKALEKRRQLLQRELELQMNTDPSSKHNNTHKKRSSSSSSTSSSSSVGPTSSSSSSTPHKLDSKKNFPNSPEHSVKKLSKMVYKENSPGRKGGLNKKSPSRKVYKKSLSPNQAATSRNSPTKRIVSRKKEVDGRDRSRQRSLSRERRRARSKEVRHRQRVAHSSHSSLRGSERKKEEDRGRRGDERRDRRSGVRDSRRELGDELRLREKMREKERCRQRDEARREKCGRSTRPAHQSRAKELAAGYPPPRHSPLSPTYHHHYRPPGGERSRYGGSTERDRLSGYKEMSPREQAETRMRLGHPSSSSYPDSTRIRRRGWEGGRYDSAKTSTREWEAQPANERVHEWQRRSKHSQDKDYAPIDKDKDLDWKRGGVCCRDLEEGGGAKRPRLDEPPPPPPPPPPIINEPDLSDISDDPDDILNRDDVEEERSLDERRGEGLHDVMDCGKEEESQPPLSTASSNLEHRLLDPRIGEDEGMDFFEEISDEDLEEESKNNKGSDVLVEDWASFIAECRVEKKTSESQVSCGKPWDTNNILRRIGVSRQFAGDKLFNALHKQLTQDGGEGLSSDVGGLQSAMLQRKQRLSAAETDKVAISARSDLAFRRQLCGLPVVAVDNFSLYQYQAV